MRLCPTYFETLRTRQSSRDLEQWRSQVDSFLRLRPSVLVPSHGRPVEDATQVRELLVAYRDAIQLVDDQAARMWNRGPC